MQHSDLDPLIQNLKEKPLPPVADIEASVLQAIRQSAPVSHGRPAADWLDILLAPRMAALCLLLVLLSSAGVTALTSHAQKNTADYPSVAARALDFDTFQSSDLLAFSTSTRW
ncbi:MAG: hypothetical protein R6U56_04965 [Opitutales bacterium]